jgi:transposase
MLPSMDRAELTDAQWERLRPMLPPQKPRSGRPAKDHRIVLEGILWIMRTGAPWRDLPSRFGSWRTVSSRFYRWRSAGVWDVILTELQRQADADGRLDWSLHFVDSTVVRAHQHAAGAKGADPPAEALGQSRGGFSTKLHLRSERSGKPLVVVLTAGERHEQPVLSALLGAGAVKRPGRGRPRVRPDAVVGDKGYSSGAVRHYLRDRGIAAVIPAKAYQSPRPGFNQGAYRERNVVERLINRLKQFRRVATRYEKRAANYQAMVTLAAILLWL